MKAFWAIFSLSCLSVFLVVSLSFFYSHFYPVKYVAEINKYSQQYNVQPALIASVINTESGYNANATSNKGAKGLMQLMPSTAEWLCELLREPYAEEKLTEPDYNIKLGTFYLSYLQNKFAFFDSYICAYNAGPTQVKAWLNSKQYSSDGQKLEKIPFVETKNYLKKVNKNLNYYAKKYK